MKKVILVFLLAYAVPCAANDWEKFYTSTESDGLLASDRDPEVVSSTGDTDHDVEAMWRRGYAPIGYSLFNTGNDNVKDGMKLAKKLKARFVIFSTRLTSSSTASVPLTMPTTKTSVTNGTVSAYGSGGYATGNYSGTTTTYGSQTSYIPITVNRFDKMGVYFKEVPKTGSGIFPRELSAAEVTQLETRRAFAVRSVRDGSPAYNADVLPGDVIVQVNGAPADAEHWQAAVKAGGAIATEIVRNGQHKTVVIQVPSEWMPK